MYICRVHLKILRLKMLRVGSHADMHDVGSHADMHDVGSHADMDDAIFTGECLVSWMFLWALCTTALLPLAS